jgi:hypothetical protein
MWGQFAELCVLDEDDEDDGVDEELLVAAFAIAAPPPTRTPVRVRAASALLSRGLISVHLLSPGSSQDGEPGRPLGRSREGALKWTRDVNELTRSGGTA